MDYLEKSCYPFNSVNISKETLFFLESANTLVRTEGSLFSFTYCLKLSLEEYEVLFLPPAAQHFVGEHGSLDAGQTH